METRVAAGGHGALVDMPADQWREIGAIGTIDDAVAHVESLEEAGVASVSVFPGPSLEVAEAQLAPVSTLAAR